MSTTMFEKALSDTLLAGDGVEMLISRNKSLEARVKLLEAALAEEQSPSKANERFINRLYEDVYGDTLPSGVDYDELYGRLVTLVADDEDECWSPEREFDVEITFSVTVKGTYKAKTTDEIKEHFTEHYPTLSAYSSDLTHVDVDYDVVEIEATEA